MGKKKTSRVRKSTERVSKTRSRKTTKHVDGLLAMSRSERIDFFENCPREHLLKIFEESYGSELVNILLDLKKATVKRFLELVGRLRKRAVVETATLYHYKEYLTNPLPLQVEAAEGHILPNYYAILGVPREASEEDLQMAYKLLARAHGPEIFSPMMRKAGEDRLHEIQDAYSHLKTPARRQKADRLLPNISYLYPRRDQFWLESVLRLLG